VRLPAKLEQHRSLFIAVCAFIVGVLITFPLHYALAATSTDTTYYACVKTSDGTLRIVSANTTCKSSETLISWNQQGPAGPTGPQGPQGPAGSGGDVFSLRPFLCYSCNLSAYADKFRGQDWSNIQMPSVMIDGVDIHGVNFSGSYMSGDVLTNDNLSGANFTNLKDIGGNASTGEMDFDGSNLTNAVFDTNTGYNRYSFSGANLTGIDFTGDSFSRTPFNGADFQSTNLTNVTFWSNTDLTGALHMDTATGLDSVTWAVIGCPDGSNPQDNGGTCIGHLNP
jgi:hypothetical protein